jgi:hypothetical protein
MTVQRTNQQWRLMRMQVTCLAEQIPNFNLEDKDYVPGGAIDGDSIWKSRIRTSNPNPISRIIKNKR